MKTFNILMSLLLFNLTGIAQQFIQTTTNPSNYAISLLHNSELKLGNNSSSQADRERCVLKFGSTNFLKIGEFEKEYRLSFQATSFSFLGGSIYNPYNVDLVIGPDKIEGSPRLRFHHNGTHAYIDFKDNLNFRADKNWVCPLILFGNGTVGIGLGTTYNSEEYKNLGYMLAVNGGIICEKVKVISDVPGADYVFEDNYQLRTISEVEDFIKKNKHLPEIPSALEFKKGYSVGEMDEMLLKKIEELSLYIIELNKRIETLENDAL